MPLITNEPIPYIAIHDFPAYKVMQKVDDYYLVCPPNDEWNKTKYKFRTLYETDSHDLIDYRSSDGIGQGFFHTFLDLNEAENYVSKIKSDYPERQYAILNVTIPQGALYYVGRYTRYTDLFTYASNKVIYESEVENSIATLIEKSSVWRYISSSSYCGLLSRLVTASEADDKWQLNLSGLKSSFIDMIDWSTIEYTDEDRLRVMDSSNIKKFIRQFNTILNNFS